MSQNESRDGRIRSLGDEKYSARKNMIKRIRVIIELIVVALMFFVLYTLFYSLDIYKPYDTAGGTAGDLDTGFVALSYFGVDRIGDTSTLISQKQLDKHLSALKDQGYVTITQQDIR